MGKSLNIDWTAVEKDYISGKSRTFIANTYGLSYNTLDSRIRRFKWVARREAVIGKIAQVRDEGVIKDQAGRQARYLNRIANQVDHSLDVLESQMPCDRKEVREQVEVLEKIDRIARPALGLASTNQGSNGKTVVNLAILRSEESVKPAIEV